MCVKQVCQRERIFGLSSASEPSGFDVGENVSDDFPKVGGTQGTMLQVFAVSPEGRRVGSDHMTQP